jgi:hypothetical protein
MSFASPPPRRGPEPLCFQPLAPIERSDDRSPLTDFCLNMLFALAGAWIVVMLIIAFVVGRH